MKRGLKVYTQRNNTYIIVVILLHQIISGETALGEPEAPKLRPKIIKHVYCGAKARSIGVHFIPFRQFL